MGCMRKRSILFSLTSAAAAAVVLTATPMVARAIRAEGTKPAAAFSVPTTTSAAPGTQLPTSTPAPTPTPTATPTPAQAQAQAQALSAYAQATLAWDDHHDTVRQWAAAALGGPT
jgi:hypothetical protein